MALPSRCTSSLKSVSCNARNLLSLRCASTSIPIPSFRVPSHKGVPTAFDPTRSVELQDKILFTPGPLTTSYPIKKAATIDFGSRDSAFMQAIKDVCSGVLKVANVSEQEYTCVPIQGSGTYGVEATLSSAVDRSRGVLIIANGAYGSRMATMAQRHNMRHYVVECSDNQLPDLNEIEKVLQTTAKDVSHVAIVHSETTSGIVNDIEAVGQLAKRYGKSYIVDAMSSFGGIPIDFKTSNIDFLVSCPNKCLEGIPGLAFIIAKKESLAKCKGNCDTLVLDIEAQRAALDASGQFRFTPPTHVMLAARQAIIEMEQEGGSLSRARRYKENQKVCQESMEKMGFKLYLPKHLQGHIISSYHYPTDPNWNFNTFYKKLNDKGFVIYPGKVSKADCFRIGHIGRIFPEDTAALMKAVDQVCNEMKTGGYYKAN